MPHFGRMAIKFRTGTIYLYFIGINILFLFKNSTQLDILDETAENLNGRHKLLTDMLALRPSWS